MKECLLIAFLMSVLYVGFGCTVHRYNTGEAYPVDPNRQSDVVGAVMSGVLATPSQPKSYPLKCDDKTYTCSEIK